MNLEFPQDKDINRSKYWSWLDRQVYETIKDKVIAYKGEIEYELELKGVGHFDTGESIKYLSKEAPIRYITTRKVEINNNLMDFYHLKETKKPLIKKTLKKKKKVFTKYRKNPHDLLSFVVGIDLVEFPNYPIGLGVGAAHIEQFQPLLTDHGSVMRAPISETPRP